MGHEIAGVIGPEGVWEKVPPLFVGAKTKPDQDREKKRGHFPPEIIEDEFAHRSFDVLLRKGPSRKLGLGHGLFLRLEFASDPGAETSFAAAHKNRGQEGAKLFDRDVPDE